MADSGLYDSESDVSSIAHEDNSDQESLFSTESPEANRAALDDEQQRTSEVGSAAVQASKAIEAAEESTPEPADAPAGPSYSFQDAQTTDNAWFSEQTPLLDAGPAPPDYAAATAWRTAESTRVNIWSDTVSNQASRPLKDYLTSLSPWSQLIKDRRRRQVIRRFAKWLCLAQLVIVCVVFTTVIVVKQKVQRARQYDDHPMYNWDHPERYHSSTSECQFQSYSALASTYYKDRGVPDSGDFRFWEAMSTGDQYHRNGRITGRIEFRPAPYWQKERFDIWYNTAATKPWTAELPEIVVRPNGLHLNSPWLNKDPATELENVERRDTVEIAPAPCYDVWIRVYVAGGMENFELHTAILDIDIGSGLPPGNRRIAWDLDVQNQTNISATYGSMKASILNSRLMHIETVAGSIKGSYGLCDKTSLISRTGRIAPQIFPCGISESLAHVGGDEPAPYGEEGLVRQLHTFSGSGETSLLMFDPIYLDERPTQSYHYSDSGCIGLRYGAKDSWQGNIDIKASNGTIRLEGKDVELLPSSGSGHPVTHVRAKQGNHTSDLRVETTRGDVWVIMQWS